MNQAHTISPTGTLRQRRHVAACTGLVGLALAFALCGCAQPAGPQAAAQPPATLPATLKADPRFSTLVHVIEFAGQWQAFADARDVTMLAPTDAAFQRSDPSWGAILTGDDDATVAKRKKFLRPLLIRGRHPPSDFIGKMQDVRSVAGDVLHLDGRTPGTIVITAGPPAQTGIGFPTPVIRTSRMQLPPLVTTAGPIYPVDAIIIQ